MENEKSEAEKNYEQMEGKRKRKMVKYFQRQMKKHPDVPIVNIQEKLQKKFNVKLVR